MVGLSGWIRVVPVLLVGQDPLQGPLYLHLHTEIHLNNYRLGEDRECWDWL